MDSRLLHGIGDDVSGWRAQNPLRETMGIMIRMELAIHS